MVPAEDLDIESLVKWLAGRGFRLAWPVKAHLVTGGRSNLTYSVEDREGLKVVLRRPPAGRLGGRSHDVLREHRILEALQPTAVPVPATLAACADMTVIGAPFFVMESVEGLVLDRLERAAQLSPQQRYQLGMALVEVLATIHAVDPDQVGLGDLSPSTSYAQRQISRWSGQWNEYRTRDLPAVEESFRLLAEAIPDHEEAVIVHHDYRLGNLIVQSSEVRAVLDWELAALGDPIADLGLLGVRIGVPAEVLAPFGEPLTLDGFPGFDELVGYYAKVSGRPVRHLGFYVALAALRWTVIAEGIYVRFLNGVMGGQQEDLAFLRDRVDLLADFTVESARHLD